MEEGEGREKLSKEENEGKRDFTKRQWRGDEGEGGEGSYEKRKSVKERDWETGRQRGGVKGGKEREVKNEGERCDEARQAGRAGEVGEEIFIG